MFKITKNIGIIIVIALIHFYFHTSEYVKKVDYQVYDFMMMLTNQIKQDDSFYTIVIDIDEKSLQAFGQWPWSRVITANLIDKIHALNPSALGVNILFPEEDRLSPVNIQNFYKTFLDLEVAFKQIPPHLKDNDKLLFNSIVKSGATLSTSFYDSVPTSKHCQNVLYKENTFFNRKTNLNADAFLCNHEKLQNGVENFGFINAWRDSDGTFRRIPLFIQYEGKVFPSFSLATILSFDKDFHVDSKEDTILLNFPLHKPKVFSAIDILNGRITKGEVQGKIVILGTSLVGLSRSYRISTGEKISNSMINAFAIDNILNESFLRQAPKYKILNLFISTMLILWCIVLFTKKAYFQIILLLLVITFISFMGTFYAYLEGMYISIAYLWFPFTFLFILLIIYHIRTISEERTEQEKFLIRQSKLASMGEMISLIAHQWRQPLSAINGVVLNMDIDYRKKKLDEEKLDAYLNEIESTTGYLSNTINDFTEFFSTNKQSQTFNLFKIIERAKQLSSISSYKNIELVYQKDESIYVKGHESELVQSLLVLINNAIYQVNLKTKENGKVLIYGSIIDNNIVISVEDNGGGIKKKEIKKIFDPYFTTKEEHHGTGLGLYILKLIVEDSMNGKVSVGNGKHGAIFTIKIPKNMK